MDIGGPTLARMPDLQDLEAALSLIFRTRKLSKGRFKIINRSVNPSISTYATEIITVETGERFKIFAKYGMDPHNSHGHRGGIPYEAKVYEQIVDPLPITKAAFYGSCQNLKTEETWLFIENLDDCYRLNKTSDSSASIISAATWLGKFHASQLNTEPASFLRKYDWEYYKGWADRTIEYSNVWRKQFPWLKDLLKNTEWISYLLQLPQTLVHGEYYPANILYRNGSIYPIDWESAAIAVGEIDLASLTEGWPDQDIRNCEDAYNRARWPVDPPADFAQRMSAARFYLGLRWLGDNFEWTPMEASSWRFKSLHKEALQMGLLS